MSASHRHLQRTTDQTSGAVQRQAVKSTTIGSALRGAEGNRAANAGSSRRALKSAVADWLKDARATSKALDESLNALNLNAGNDQLKALFEGMVEQLLAHLLELATSAQDLGEQIATAQAEQSTDNAGQPNEEGVVETGTGEVPHEDASAGALDSAAMDAGVRAVLDHVAPGAGRHEPGSVSNPFIVDSLRVSKLRERAELMEIARNPEKVRFTGVDDPLTDYSQLQHVKLLKN